MVSVETAVQVLSAGARCSNWRMTLKAYIDDSGIGDQPVYCLAGWIASAEKWSAFTKDWEAVLRMRPSIRFFKANEAKNGDGEFNGIIEEQGEKIRR